LTVPARTASPKTAQTVQVASESPRMALSAPGSTASSSSSKTRTLKGTGGCPCCLDRACAPAGES
jgi:hypothetical protein